MAKDNRAGTAVTTEAAPDLWTNVGRENTQLLQRCLDIMRVMSTRYNAIDVDHWVRPWMAGDKGAIAYYLDATREIALPYVYSPKHRMYDITSFGFLSSDVQGVLDLSLAKVRQIIATSGESNTVFGGVPATFDYPGMTQLLALLPSQPGVNVVVRPVTADFAIWRVTV